VLAKDPARLAASDDQVALEQLLPEIVDDHRPLCADKQLALALDPLPAVAVRAPLPIVQAAIGTLLRNAIEHSDRGEVRITLRPDAVVEIVDPGHGMSPEEIAALYARHARGEGRDGGGIGLALVARLCAHLGWRLAITAAGDGPGTRVTLDFGASHDFPTPSRAS
jgi:signal transduction histidine kinase